MLQRELISRVYKRCHEDPHLRAAMMYGSFAKGGGDAFSDIEFVLFFADETFNTIKPALWLSQVSSLELCYLNRYGIYNVIFSNMVRGEFHFKPLSQVTEVAKWGETDWFPSLESTLVVDKDGELTPYLQQLVGDRRETHHMQELLNACCNWLLFGVNVWQRGEYARALDLLWWVQRHLLQMVRVLEGQTENWPTPSKSLEEEISAEAYKRYSQCTCGLNPEALLKAYHHCWEWLVTMLPELKRQHDAKVTLTLQQGLDDIFATIKGQSLFSRN